MMRHYLAVVADLSMAASSAFLALLIRDNFVFYEPRWQAIVPYALITLASTVAVFGVLRPHKALWQYTSLTDILHLIAAVSLALLLALFVSFALSRLEGIARSVPVIQWLLLIVMMVTLRLAARIWHERRVRPQPKRLGVGLEHVLVIGASHLTELYLESLERYAAKKLKVVGILSDRGDFRGRLLRRLVILGTPEELPSVISQLEIHGVTVQRIAVIHPMAELSLHAREDLLALERNSGIHIDWLAERLGFDSATVDTTDLSQREKPATKFSAKREVTTLGRYGYLKRATDLAAASLLLLALAPVGLLVSMIVAVDVGTPIVFWQQRPGRAGRPFRLYKFRTMRAAHDSDGNRIPDAQRSSWAGNLLRRLRLDELPQLYNILVGEMSFVGPRPLLPWDQPVEVMARLRVRPGLTGLAQVHGERSMSPDEKNTLDLWYIHEASFWLDVRILCRTMLVLVRGEKIDQAALRTARKGLERIKKKAAKRAAPAAESAEAAQPEILPAA
jgi:lipopolysaccharide/colanic/teichoic acid biosynthesis glycosyltransferase